MSDLEKVIAFARQINNERAIELRWEGAGNCMHPAHILRGLQVSDIRGNPIHYRATINIFERADSANGVAARERMGGVADTEASTQSFSIHFNQDVSRDHMAGNQNPADIMFVRNIMLLTNDGGSATHARDDLLALHTQAIRARSNSLREAGQVRMGMSGAPGLEVGIPRRTTPVGDLFDGFDQLNREATDAGLQGEDETRLGETDFDRAEVMKNTGVSLGEKDTFYLTFVRPAVGAAAPVAMNLWAARPAAVDQGLPH